MHSLEVNDKNVSFLFLLKKNATINVIYSVGVFEKNVLLYANIIIVAHLFVIQCHASNESVCVITYY